MSQVVLNEKPMIGDIEVTPNLVAERAVKFMQTHGYRVCRAIISARRSISGQQDNLVRKFIKGLNGQEGLLENKIIIQRMRSQIKESSRKILTWQFEIEDIVRETISIKKESAK